MTENSFFAEVLKRLLFNDWGMASHILRMLNLAYRYPAHHCTDISSARLDLSKVALLNHPVAPTALCVGRHHFLAFLALFEDDEEVDEEETVEE